MKTIAKMLLITISLCIFTGCESEEEKIQRKIEESSAAYEAQAAKVDAIEAEIAINQAKIDALEK